MSTEKIEGYLAYFDLQGFSELISNQGFDEKFEKFYTLIEETVEIGGKDIFYKFFSDSIVIYSKEITEEKLIEISGILSHICINLLAGLDLVLSGGLSCGEFTIHEHEGNIIFAGNPMVDAVKIEQKQNWFGVSISHLVVKKNRPIFNLLVTLPFHNANVDQMIKRLKNPKLLYYIQEYPEIPIKTQSETGDTVAGYIITPQFLNPEDPKTAAINIHGFRDLLQYLKYRNNSPKVQTKYKNTTIIIETILSRWNGIQGKYF